MDEIFRPSKLETFFLDTLVVHPSKSREFVFLTFSVKYEAESFRICYRGRIGPIVQVSLRSDQMERRYGIF